MGMAIGLCVRNCCGRKQGSPAPSEKASDGQSCIFNQVNLCETNLLIPLATAAF